MNKSNVILKGNIVFSKNLKELEVIEHGFIVCCNERVKGVYRKLPAEFEGLQIQDYGECLIIPGLVDLHIHAPQYSFRGLGMDMELLDWLEENTFPEEGKFCDLEYAEKAYSIFTENLKKSATTRACIFATVHREASILLMDKLEKSGLATMVGKVNMDRNAPKYLREESYEVSAEQTIAWLKNVKERGYKNTQPILTPRFIPSCTDALMEELKKIQDSYELPVQSHLSENPSEGKWVKELCPWSEFYGDAYDRFGLFGSGSPTVMAHCVYSDDKEIKMIKERGVYVAHCPESNMNLSSGIAPVQRFLEEGIHVGLGSDVAAGSTENIFHAMKQAIQVSKLRWRLQDSSLKPLTVEEVFYMATKGGGEFFGKVGSFEAGYEFDAVILDDSRLKHPQELDVKKRLERMIYLSDDREIKAKYVRGNQVL
jgi:guanine deaminase